MFKRDLIFEPQIMNAAGYGGFSPDIDIFHSQDVAGAFITNPISYRKRKPASGEHYHPHPGGFLLHTGLPNPGFRKVIKANAGKWERTNIQVIPHLIAQDPYNLEKMVHSLEEMPAVSGIEIGFRSDHSIPEILDLLSAAEGELPIIAKLNIQRHLEDLDEIMENGVFAISFSAPRGSMVEQGKILSGRLQGPAQTPSLLNLLLDAAKTNIHLIPSVWEPDPGLIDEIIRAGAAAVQIETFSLNPFRIL